MDRGEIIKNLVEKKFESHTFKENYESILISGKM